MGNSEFLSLNWELSNIKSAEFNDEFTDGYDFISIFSTSTRQ